jgi:hypothetical protein
LELETLNPLDIRLRALDWLFSATRPWLFQGQTAAPQFPHENDVGWKAIGNLAHVHNVEPLLYWVVSNTEIPTKIPECLKQKWEQAYFGNFLRNEEYFDVLKTLLGRCEKEQIPIIVLKGPALIGRIYEDPALRTLSDLDILCSPTDLNRIVTIARQMGYTMMDVGDDPEAAHHVAMVQVAGGAILEFHFMPYEVIQNHEKFMQLAWDRKEWIEAGKIHFPVLSLEMELLFNIAHLVQHQFDVSLKHYLDIAGLLVFCGGQLNWGRIGTLFRDSGLEQVFSLTMGFLRAMMCLPQMSRTSQLSHEDGAQQEFDASLRDLLALLDEDRLLDVKGVIWRFRVAIGNREGFGSKIDYVVKTLFPFSGSLADHGIIRSSGGVRYCLRQCLFYGKRLLLSLSHLPKKGPSNKKHSLAVHRAHAKNRITRQVFSRFKPTLLCQLPKNRRNQEALPEPEQTIDQLSP